MRRRGGIVPNQYATPEARLEARRESGREGMKRHKLRKRGLLPPPTAAGIAAWWRAREPRA